MRELRRTIDQKPINNQPQIIDVDIDQERLILK